MKRITYVIVGSVLFALSVNVFMIPASIYNGGVSGIAQLVRDAIIAVFKINPGFDILGIVNFVLNIPFFIFAWNRLSPKFVQLSLLSIITQTVTFTLIPIPAKPLVEEVSIGIVLAAVIGAFGASLTYRAKASSGGMDIVGFYFSQKNKGSIGKVNMIINSVIYAVCFFAYNAQTALYSLVYSFIFSYGLDNFHEHNLEASVMVFTKNTEIKHIIMEEVRRGVTHWDGFGAYTGNKLDVFMTIAAQSEVPSIRKLVKKHDPNAFIVVSKNLKVHGGFEKRLI